MYRTTISLHPKTRAMLAVPAALLLGSCRSVDLSPVLLAAVPGTYVLTFVNYEPLPHIVTVADTTLKILADTFFVRANNTYSEHAYYSPGGASFIQGTYTNVGETYTFVDAANPSNVVTASIPLSTGIMEIVRT